jgi:arylformamidase
MSAGRWLKILAARRAAAGVGNGRGGLLERLTSRDGAAPGVHGLTDAGRFELPTGARLLADVAYGAVPAQCYDLYLPRGAVGAPVFAMVHGGGWSRGDKALWRSVRNKVACWVDRGYVLASVNYRMLPEASPLAQADDVARALAHLQANAAAWGGDPARVLLVGHSSGAHLASLIAADPSIGERAGATSCAGVVAIDSAAFDVQAIMGAPHLGLYDRAFGPDPVRWREASPLHRLRAALAVPMLAVCSARRGDSCPQAQVFAAKARATGGRVDVLAIDLSHGELNDLLGTPGEYTDAVLAFLRSIGLP